MSFILDLYSYYKKNDKVIEKETFVAGIYGVTTLDLNNHDFIEEIYKTVENRYESLDKMMEDSAFSFNYMWKWKIKCVKSKWTKRKYKITICHKQY